MFSPTEVPFTSHVSRFPQVLTLSDEERAWVAALQYLLSWEIDSSSDPAPAAPIAAQAPTDAPTTAPTLTEPVPAPLAPEVESPQEADNV